MIDHSGFVCIVYTANCGLQRWEWTVNAAGISAVTEPASFALLWEGVVAIAAGRKLPGREH